MLGGGSVSCLNLPFYVSKTRCKGGSEKDRVKLKIYSAKNFFISAKKHEDVHERPNLQTLISEFRRGWKCSSVRRGFLTEVLFQHILI